MWNPVGRRGLPKQRRWIPKPNHHPHQSSGECSRRLNQIDESKLTFHAIKITPRRVEDFTSKCWSIRNAKNR